MKKNLFTFYLFVFSTCVWAQNPKTIEKPAYEVKNSGIYDVTKIELTGSSTRLTVHNTFLPHWWVRFDKDTYIKDCHSGKKYELIEIEGAKIGEQLWMPASGDSTIVLIFPKLEEGVEMINFNTDIFGISLNKSKLKEMKDKKGIPAHVSSWLEEQLAFTAGKEQLDFGSTTFFKEETAHLIGYIEGYDPRLGFTSGIIYSNNLFTREDFPTVVKIYPDGRFEAKFEMQCPSYSYMVINNRIFHFYLEPGQTLAMKLKWDEFLTADRLRNIRYKFKEVEYAGPLAKVNHDIEGFEGTSPDYRAIQKKFSTYAPEDFKRETMAALKAGMEELDKYLNESDQKGNNLTEVRKRSKEKDKSIINPISAKAAAILKNQVLLENTNQLFDFVMDRKYLAREDSTNEILKLPVPSDYYNFLKEMPLDDPSLLVSGQYQTFINRFEYSRPFDDAYPNVINGSFLDYMLNDWSAKDSVAPVLLGNETNLTYEIAKVRTLKYASESLTKDETREYWDKLKGSISHRSLHDIGDKFFDETFNEGFGTAYELPSGKATEVFKNIIDPFKGKILFVDFWATSCGPCIANIKQMKDTREKYKDNPDFDFIFITEDRSSPEDKYNSFVEEQSLDKTFRIAQEDFYYLRELFKFNGIPRYIVIDEEGRVMDENFKMYRFDTELAKILAKN